MQLWDEHQPNYKTTLPYRIAFLCSIALLVFLGLKWQSNLTSVMDVLAADEAEYLRNGLALFDKVYKDWGPSYNIWYKILSIFTTTKLELYYLNFTITAVFAAVLLFVVLERYGISLIVALFLSALFFISELNIETWPRVSHFVFICLMIGLYISYSLKNAAQQLFLFAGIAIIAAYARPEIRPFAFIILLMAFIVAYWNKISLKSYLLFAISALILFVFFQIVYGSPASFYRGNVDRMYIAFCQHVAVNEFLHHDKTVDAMAGWRVYADKVFPKCDTFSCILTHYPMAIVQNVLYNIPTYLLTILQTLGSFLFPIVIFKKKKIFLGICVALLIFILGNFIYKPSRTALFEKFKKYKWPFIALFIIGTPTMMTSLLIFPRMHYLMCHLFLILFVLAFFMNEWYKRFKIPTATFIVVVIFFIVISPTAANYKFFRDNDDLGNLCGQKYVHYFNKDQQKKHIIFSDILNLSYLLPNNYSDYSVEYDFKKNMQFDSVRRANKIDIVFVNQNILKNPYLSKDSTWLHFLKRYEDFGFEKKQIYNECNIYILQQKK
ncbi:MAG TPA: hypothetical protein PLJ42_01715 [Chitinophagales bacterium]|jgi:hypothetical protein|nr:hypothetical protein [Chitinophagales bacterium]MBP6154453.1 hypothetical protein [Chitinophagales bacterium]HQV77648.1 hypothetical protein [Chitinophagales bacterium]HQW78121.1 hypothetical protein [Chitinophagales bacterium]